MRSVISEYHWKELEKQNKNIPLLVTRVTTVGITGIQSKRVTKQVQLNIQTEGIEFNTFLVVKELKLEVILGDDFFEKV